MGLIGAAKPIEIPVYMVEMVNKWRRAASEIECEHGHPATTGEVARAMGLSRKKVEVIARAALAFSSPFQPITEDSERSLSEMLADESSRSPADVLLENRRHEAVMKHLSAIDERAQAIVRMRFGLEGCEPMTLKQIGRKIGLTRERVRHKTPSRMATLSPGQPGPPVLQRRPPSGESRESQRVSNPETKRAQQSLLSQNRRGIILALRCTDTRGFTPHQGACRGRADELCQKMSGQRA